MQLSSIIKFDLVCVWVLFCIIFVKDDSNCFNEVSVYYMMAGLANGSSTDDLMGKNIKKVSL